MMKWAKERDSLIAQTRAFVTSVIAWKADTTPPPVSVAPVAIENTFAVVAPPPVEAAGSSDIAGPEVATSELSGPAAALPAAEPPSAEEPSASDVGHNDVRKEIQSRVAAFQAHQHRFARERDAYFNSVLTKARSTVDSSDGYHDEQAT
jgi:hypothetical protein